MVLLFYIIIITQIFYEEITDCEIKRYPYHYICTLLLISPAILYCERRRLGLGSCCANPPVLRRARSGPPRWSGGARVLPREVLTLLQQHRGHHDDGLGDPRHELPFSQCTVYIPTKKKEGGREREREREGERDTHTNTNTG